MGGASLSLSTRTKATGLFRKRTYRDPIVDKRRPKMSAADAAEIRAIAFEHEEHHIDAAVAAVYERTTLGNVYSRQRITSVISRYRRKKAQREDALVGDNGGRLSRLRHELCRLVPRQPIGRRIGFALDYCGLSQKWLALRSHASERMVNYWVNQETLPRADHAYQVAKAFGISADIFWREQALGDPQFEMTLDEMLVTSRELAAASREGRVARREFVR